MLNAVVNRNRGALRLFAKNLTYLLIGSVGRGIRHKIVPILLYHSVDFLDKDDCVSPPVFYKQMEYLYEKDYKVLSIDEVVSLEGSQDKRLFSDNVIAITFDDGYLSIYEHVRPILKKLNFPATIFIPTAYIGKTSEWTKPASPLLNWNEIFELKSNGFTIASHGHSHQDLSVMEKGAALRELEVSKDILEKNLGERIDYISYPFSKHNRVVESLVIECGYKASFSVISTGARKADANSVVRRTSVLKEDRMAAFKLFVSGKYHHYSCLKYMLAHLWT